MKISEIAAAIPAEYRKEILETNMIADSIAQRGNPQIEYLANVWKVYVEAAFNPTCNRCLETLKRNFVIMQPILIKLEQESKLLNDL